MKEYIVNAPLGEITIGLSYNTIVFKNGEIVKESDITRTFPDFFVLYSETKEEETVEETKKTETNVTRKVGRPKKIFK